MQGQRTERSSSKSTTNHSRSRISIPFAATTTTIASNLNRTEKSWYLVVVIVDVLLEITCFSISRRVNRDLGRLVIGRRHSWKILRARKRTRSLTGMNKFTKKALMNFTITLCKQVVMPRMKWKNKKKGRERKVRKVQAESEKIKGKVVGQATTTIRPTRMNLLEIDRQSKAH